MKIGTREIGNGNPCYIIAEAGTAYLGDMVAAFDHVWAAKQAGADAIKFQMFVKDEPLFCPLPGDEKRMERWNRCVMDVGDWLRVKGCADAEGIDFLASAFQPTAVQWLKQLGVSAYKVASRAAATYPYDAVPGPFIISNGLGGQPRFRSDQIVLQCVPKYPTPLNESRWHEPQAYMGLSDHSGTIWPGLDAMARGVPILEVHFAIDKADAGNDAPVCLSVDQLKLLCEARDAFAAMRPH